MVSQNFPHHYILRETQKWLVYLIELKKKGKNGSCTTKISLKTVIAICQLRIWSQYQKLNLKWECSGRRVHKKQKYFFVYLHLICSKYRYPKNKLACIVVLDPFTWHSKNWNSWSSIDCIRKFVIRLIRKGKKYPKNLKKINSNLICSIWLQLGVGVKLSEIGFVQNSFDSIQTSATRLIQKVKNSSKNLITINTKFNRFVSTPPLT